MARTIRRPAEVTPPPGDVECVAVQTKVPSVAPGQDQRHFEDRIGRVDAGRSSEHVNDVERESAQSDEAREQADDEWDAEGQLTQRDQLADPRSVGDAKVVEGSGPPAVTGPALARGRPRDPGGGEALDPGSASVPESSLLAAPDLLVSGVEPPVAQYDSHDEPDDAGGPGAVEPVSEAQIAFVPRHLSVVGPRLGKGLD